jgi:TRAP-type C4-dicarboxylate transport system substrate-binding protein
MRRSLTVLALCPALAACSLGGGASKSGGEPVKPASSGRTVTLRFATANSTPAQAAFFKQLALVSGGRLRATLVPYDTQATDVDIRLARDVARGRVDVAEVGARAWESAGVGALRAFQSPLLISSEALLDRALADRRVTEPLLQALRPLGVTGLALLPSGVRYVFATRPLDSVQAFRGARIRVNASPTTEDILGALGARPVTDVEGGATVIAALRSGRLDGIEADMRTATATGYVAAAPYVGAPLFAKATTIVGNTRRLRRLGPEASGWIALAARRTAESEIAGDARLAWRVACGAGLKPARVTAGQLDALETAMLDVHAALEGDQTTALAIDRIGLLATAAPPDSWAGCGAKARVGTPVDGVYEFTATEADERRYASAPGNAGRYRVHFGSGRYAVFHFGPKDPLLPGWDFARDPVEVGTVAIRGDVAVLRPQTSIGVGSTPKTYRFELFRDRLRWTHASGPEDWLMSAHPWRKVS